MTTSTKATTILVTGKSGKKYKYWIYPIGAAFKREPGNYVFLKKLENGRFKVIYVGETDDLANRLNNALSHHKWACIQRNGATYIAAHTNDGGAKARKVEEADLIAAYRPPCNG